jgi:uncharacterized protein YciI
MLVVDFPSIEECKKWVNADPYIAGRVWDGDKVEVMEYRMAIKKLFL